MRLRALPSCAAAAAAVRAQTLEQAEALWKQHRYDEANDAFRALVKAHPTKRRIPRALGPAVSGALQPRPTPPSFSTKRWRSSEDTRTRYWAWRW